MTVYVAVHHWDTPENEGVEVLGVYSAFEKAREQIEAGAAAIRKEYEDDMWEADMTWDEPAEIHLGRTSDFMGDYATIYSWQIVEREIE